MTSQLPAGHFLPLIRDDLKFLLQLLSLAHHIHHDTVPALPQHFLVKSFARLGPQSGERGTQVESCCSLLRVHCGNFTLTVAKKCIFSDLHNISLGVPIKPLVSRRKHVTSDVFIKYPSLIFV